MVFRLVAMTGMAVFGLVSCGGSSGSAAAPKVEAGDLRRAVEATLASKSFMIHVRDHDGGAAVVSTTLFQAPDRLRTVTGDGTQIIRIGDTLWTQPPAHGPVGSEETMHLLNTAADGPFVRSHVAADQPWPLDATFADLRSIATSTELERVGDLLRYQAGTGPSAISGSIQIEDGRMTVWTMETSDKTRGQSGFITAFDDVVPINPPVLQVPADQPFPEACNPDGRPSRAVCDIVDLIPEGQGTKKP